VENALVAYIRYLGKMFWPRDLAVIYPHPGVYNHDPIPAWKVAGAALLLAAITGAVLAAARRKPYLPVGWFWYLGTLVPVIGLVQVGPQAMADRYTYVPLIGIFIMGVWGLADLPFPRIALAGAFGLALLACAWVTLLQVRHWRNDYALWIHNYQATPRNFYAASNVGNVLKYQALDYLNKGDTQRANALYNRAREYFEKAVEWQPQFPAGHYNLAGILKMEGKLKEAAQQYLEAAKASAAEKDWTQVARAAHEAHQAAPPEAKQLHQAAKDYLVQARDRWPQVPWIHSHLAEVLESEGKKEEAAQEFLRAAEASAALDDEAWDVAIRYARKALRAAPAHATALRAEINHVLVEYRKKKRAADEN
jgi:Tfp pilus assembly protein PilF